MQLTPKTVAGAASTARSTLLRQPAGALRQRLAGALCFSAGLGAAARRCELRQPSDAAVVACLSSLTVYADANDRRGTMMDELMLDWERSTETSTASAGDADARGFGCSLDCIWEDPIGYTLSRSSLHPPARDGEDSSSSSSSSWELLELQAYIADQRNATTAKSFTRGRHEIQATFCVAPPPRVSYLCVYCPNLKPSDFGTEPLVLATDQNLVLFRAAICIPSVCHEQAMQDLFVYQAEEWGGGSSLTRIPNPGSRCVFGLSEFGIVRREVTAGCFLRPHGVSQQQYMVAVLSCAPGSSYPGEQEVYHLHRFRSGDTEWTTTVLRFTPTKPSPGLTFFCHIANRVITLGGGFLGWVDLRQGILVCNVLADEPELSYISLPRLLKYDKEPSNADVKNVRDIAVVKGHIVYAEHKTIVVPMSYVNGTYTSDNWKVAASRWKINLGCWKGGWEDKRECSGSQISGSLSDMLSPNYATPLPRLRKLHTGLPTISLEEEDVLYLLAKVDHRDDNGFILAVDMKKEAVREAAHFLCERMVGLTFNYRPSSISRYLTAGKKEKPKKRPGLLLGSSIKKKPGHDDVTYA
ncbi:hypothetical protein EJB05_53445, partial [Eragrostis curvula]